MCNIEDRRKSNPAAGSSDISTGQPHQAAAEEHPAPGSDEISAGQPNPTQLDRSSDDAGTVSAWGDQFDKDCGSQLWSSTSQAIAGCTSVADCRTANVTGRPVATMSPAESSSSFMGQRNDRLYSPVSAAETEETVSPRGGSGGSANAVLAPPPPSTPVSAAGTPRFNANERQIMATAVNPSDTPHNLQAMGAAPGKGVGAR